MSKKILLPAIIGSIIVGLLLLLLLLFYPSQTYSKSIFSWHKDPMLPENKNQVNHICKTLGITAFYQCFPAESLYEENTISFLQAMQEQHIAVYYLTGEPQWALEEHGDTIKQEIDKIAAFNATLDEAIHIKGIVLDIEPYLTDNWAENERVIMEQYAQNMLQTYAYAQKKHVQLIACIPYWFDNTYPDILDQIIALGCDEIAIMNYHRKNERKNIENEVQLAQKYAKPIICIAELQEPGKHGLTPINTYYDVGLEAVQSTWDDLHGYFGYSQLSFSYHYYNPVQELITKLDSSE